MTHKWWVLASVACGTFMATLDSSIVNIALPTLTHSFGADLSHVKWVVIVYLLVITCLVLPFGKMSDQFGRKKIFLSGFIFFTLGSAVCSFSPTLFALILARMMQAAGAAMLMANGPAIITATVPQHERGTALGTLAMVVSAGLISGPSIGGFLISYLGWRSIFWVNIPIGFLGMLLASKHISKDKVKTANLPFDWAGSLLQTLFLISFLVLFDPPIISLSESITFLTPRWLIVLLMVIFGALFFHSEKNARAPLLDTSLLRNRIFVSSNIAGFLTFVSFSSILVLMPFYLERVLGLDPKSAGLVMTAIPITIFIVAPISGRLSDKLGSRELSIAGTVINAVTFFVISGFLNPGLGEKTEKLAIIIALSFIGLAIGLFQSPNNNAIMSSVPADKLGVASAMLATVRNLGLVTGTGFATAVFSWEMQQTGSFITSIHSTHLFSGMICCLAVFATSFKPVRKKSIK